MNIVAQLDFELAYYNVTVQHFNHYATETPLALKGTPHFLELKPQMQFSVIWGPEYVMQ